MKITDIRLDRLRLDLDPPFRAAWDPVPRRHFDATIVRVETDEGVTGVGSGDTMDGFEAFEHLFLGTDPLDIIRHVRTIETMNFHAGRYWPLEVALWDIVGKVAGLPVATLFGNVHKRVRAYASSGELKSPAERVESALAARERGFAAMKIRIDRAGLEQGIETVALVRDALGPDFEIMVDLNQAWRMAGDVEPALDFAAVRRTVERLGELGVFWVEEPLPYQDMAGLRTLRAETGVRIAAGEMLPSTSDLLSYLEHDALDVYQMDVVLAVGMHRARTLAELAHLRHRMFTPHSWTNGVGVLANLHVAAGVGGGPYFEFPYDPPGWTPERRDFMLTRPVDITPDGYVEVPDAPGLGAILDEEAVRRWRI
ncbi:mandelate racemase/muconate lactonizing enzyme family protein [Nonomuraea roseoviolacea subsp. roseoviolacea]|uniref:L-alanine-DL-glutamate epimerase-like enolase superfamily enzyme n=1 Tax=Nonomuraea roseoviolacea subsp. carminata TaxID=160689 RepID=A0ABT1K4T0_9ACTN|nr:mandelate racemase/muconate lactonizing enzyme family protein [Nonomuraea roseoviolacea]MCP2349019.1 L-alanine-DL-glutamate epimerase-like enolase superfamily enzyme [Nonomuraea roseoviolacea subsp. carminata]